MTPLTLCGHVLEAADHGHLADEVSINSNFCLCNGVVLKAIA